MRSTWWPRGPSIGLVGPFTDLLTFLTDLHAKGVDLFLHQQGLDTSTPSGRAMFQMLGVFAEFERAMIRERVMAGLARARAEGKQLGRRTVEQSDGRESEVGVGPAREGHRHSPHCSRGWAWGRNGDQAGRQEKVKRALRDPWAG